MPALSFQKQFVDAVESGEKRQTIRKYRKDGRDPKPGDTLYLYTGMRTKACRKLGEAKCLSAAEIRIYRLQPESNDIVEVFDDGRLIWSPYLFDNLFRAKRQFAQLDGFKGWPEMLQWFEKTHGLPFEGVLIRW
jgi:hypothetical protein